MKTFRYITLSFLLALANETNAQGENSRFSITPHFGLGMLLPGRQTVVNGGERMKYQWDFYNFGRVTNSAGERTFNFETTNRIGADFNYDIRERVQLNLGVNRINILSSYRPTFVYDFRGQRIKGILSDFSYYNFDFGLRYTGHSLFYVLKGNYLPDIDATFRKRTSNQSGSDIGDFTNQSNTGLRINTVVKNDIKYGLYLGIGQDLTMGGGNSELEIGISLTNVPYYQEEVNFLQNGSQIGAVKVNHLINTIFVSLNQPFVFRKKTKKIEELRHIKKPKPKVAVGQKEVEVGVGLVINDLQFEQSSSELSPESEEALKDVLAFLRNYPKARIEISGHTSSEGNRRANIELSEKRAIACKTFLEQNGISSKRIRTLGRGPDRPISINEPERNRRVEMKVLSID